MITYSATVDNAPQTTDLVITLDNGETLTILAGTTSSNTATVTTADDVYVTPGSNIVVGITSTTGGEYEALDTTDTVTTALSDDTDTTALTLNDVSVDEGVGTATLTANLANAPTTGPVVFTLSNGATLTFAIGATSATSTAFAIDADDVYIDASTSTISVASYTGGAEFESLVTTDTATLTISDTIDTVTVVLSNNASVTEATGATLEHIVSLVDSSNQPVVLAVGQTVTVNLTYTNDNTESADFGATKVVQVVISGSNQATITNTVLDDLIFEGNEQYTLGIASVVDDGSIFENLVKSNDTVTGTIIENEDIPTDDLLVHWSFDNTTNDIAPTDSVTDNVTLQNGAVLSSSSLILDGTDDYASVVNSTEINLGVHLNKTIVFNFKADTTGTGTQIIYEEGGSINGANIYLNANGEISIGAWNKGTGWSGEWLTNIGVDLRDGNLHQVVLVLESTTNTAVTGTLTGYIDGSPFATAPASGLSQHPGSIRIGGGAGTLIDDSFITGGSFEGAINDGKIYGIAFDEAQVNSLYTQEPDMITVNTNLNGSADDIYTSAGDDIITINAKTQDVTIKTGAGDDRINANDHIEGEPSIIEMGMGDDILDVTGKDIKKDADIDMGDGDDTIYVSKLKNDAVIDMGSGNDTLEITTELKDSVSIDMGSGNDTLIYSGNANKLTTDEIIDMGTGEDTLKLEGTLNLDFSDANLAQFSGLEKINLIDGSHDIILKLADVLTMTDPGNMLTITGTTDDSVSLDKSGGWAEMSSVDNGDNTTYTYSDGTSSLTLTVDDLIDTSGM